MAEITQGEESKVEAKVQDGGDGERRASAELEQVKLEDGGDKGDGLDPGQSDEGEDKDDGFHDARDGQGSEERPALLEKPSPLTLPTDLLNPHPADGLHPPDSPTTSLISSLRAQLTLLSDQTVALNQKLISSIGRSADLEDELHELQSTHATLEGRARELEVDKNRWEESMNTGLLVERSQIKDEMQKLAAGLVEEERRRGSAEERREQVESEVDELTAKLFDQANTMVAVERMSRAQAESRLKDTEENLAAAEAAVRDMQLHLQSLAPSSSQHPATSSPHSASPASVRKYVSSHVPYSEFVSFIAHLRALRPIREVSKNTFPPPLVTNLLAQPFLARAVSEDHDPTVRLDVAPDLSWLSRRSVGQAIISGDLIIEPVSTSTLLNSTSSSMHDIGCSLCGKPIFTQNVPQSPAGSHFGPPPMHPHRGSNSASSRFSLKPFFNSTASVTGSPSASATHAHSPAQSPIASPAIGATGQISSVYIFRIAKSQTQAGQGEKGDSKLYPLCRTGWCLERMRATCALWHFVRTGIIHVVWHGDDGTVQLTNSIGNPPSNRDSSGPTEPATQETTAPAPTDTAQVAPAEAKTLVQPPPLPSRKKSGWALGFKLSDKSSGSGWTRGWQSSSGTGAGDGAGAGNADSPPVTPGERRGSVGSLGAEKDEAANGGLGLGAALDIDEKKDVTLDESKEKETGGEDEKDVPTIQEPASAAATDSEEQDKAKTTTEAGDEVTLHPEAPGLSRAGSNASIPLSTTTDEAQFSTPKGDSAELPSEDEHHPADDAGSRSQEALDRENTPRPPSGDRDHAVELTSPKPDSPSVSGPASPASPSKAPPIPRRAAARNRLSALNTSSPTRDAAVDKDVSSPGAGAGAGAGSGAGSETDLSALRELADELDGAAGAEGVAGDEREHQSVAGSPLDAGVQGTEESETRRPDDKTSSTDTDDDGDGDDKHVSASPGGVDEEPFTPVNLDEKFPPSPAYPSRPSSSTNATRAPPPLPPRHPHGQPPKTPVLSHAQEGEKRFVGDDAWEEKVWKSVVRLKEDMWKARIGVVDE